MIWRQYYSDHKISFFKCDSITCTCSRWCLTGQPPSHISHLSFRTPIWSSLETAHIYLYPFLQRPEVETFHQFPFRPPRTELAAVEMPKVDSCPSWNSCRTSSESTLGLFHFWPALKRPPCAGIGSWWSQKWGSTRRCTPWSLKFLAGQWSWFFISSIFQ